MIELDITRVKLWSKVQHGSPRVPIYVDVECPSCGLSLVNRQLIIDSNYSNAIIISRAPCSACENVAYLFTIRDSGDLESMAARIFIHPTPPPDLGLATEPEIKAVSPRFVEIYEQAVRAKMMGLDELVGIGYRKALEFLIKDYLIRTQPDNETEIREASLGQCIKVYIPDSRLQKAANRTARLGNNETHYERRDEEAGDLEHLGKLMTVTLRWISDEILTLPSQAVGARTNA